MKSRHCQILRVCAGLLLLINVSPLVSGSSASESEGGAQTYTVQGVVEKIAPDHHQATIHHQAIPGYMMEMTMDFPVRNADELSGISAGDKITFTLSVGKDSDWIDHIHRVGAAPGATASPPMPGDQLAKLKPGDNLPDGDFVTEEGSTMHFSDFRGKVMAFTFFFTRCPLPDYCPLMNRNFEQTRKILLSSADVPPNWQLLSLSFDGGFDHPEVLSSYAQSYREKNPEHWLFGTASPKTLAEVAAPLGLMIMRQENSMAHNLRTVVLDTQGRVYHQFNDNQWTPQQLAKVMKEALKANQNQ